MDNTTVVLDFDISEDQLMMLKIHHKLVEERVFEDFKHCFKEVDYDKVQIWFNCEYDDNWYDLRPIYADLIKDDKIVQKTTLCSYNGSDEIPMYEWPYGDKEFNSYIVTKEMLFK